MFILKGGVSMFVRKLIAELVGTFVLVLGGVGTAVLAGADVGLLGISLAFGLSLLVMAYAIGPISGCHINPAVTLGVFLRGKMPVRDLLGYWAAQVVGGIAGAGVVLAIANGGPKGYDAGASGLASNGFGSHSPGGFSTASGFVAELVLTALLIFVVLATTDKIANAAFAGIPIGFALVLIHLVSIPVTNTSVNPARSIGPAIFAGGHALSQVWLFIVAPLLGAVVGAVAHWGIFGGATRIAASESAVAADVA